MLSQSVLYESFDDNIQIHYHILKQAALSSDYNVGKNCKIFFVIEICDGQSTTLFIWEQFFL